MFEQQSQSTGGEKKSTEDIFENTDSAPVNPPIGQPPVLQAMETPEINANLLEAADEQKNKKRLFVLGGGIAFMIILLGGIVFAVTSMDKLPKAAKQAAPAAESEAKTEQPVKTEQPAVIDTADVATSTNTSGNENVVAEQGSAGSIGASDADQDGLTDQEEGSIGSNPLKADSDDDGLFDYEEVKVYGSDPTKNDTDGDSFLDGSEVKAGYNPLGRGKLLDTTNQEKQIIE